MSPPKVYGEFIQLLEAFERSPDHVPSEVTALFNGDAKLGDLWKKEGDILAASFRKILYDDAGSWKNILIGTKDVIGKIAKWHTKLDENESLWHLRSVGFGEDGSLKPENIVSLYQQGVSELDKLKDELERMTNPSTEDNKQVLDDLVSQSTALASHSSFPEWNSFYERLLLAREQSERAVSLFEDEYAKQAAICMSAGLPDFVQPKDIRRMLRVRTEPVGDETLILELRTLMRMLLNAQEFEHSSEHRDLLWNKCLATLSEARNEVEYPQGIEEIMKSYFPDSSNLPTKDLLKHCLAMWRMSAIECALRDIDRVSIGLYTKDKVYREPNKFFQLTTFNNKLDSTRRAVTVILDVLQKFEQILSRMLTAVNNAKMHMHDMFINIMVNEGGMALEDRDAFRDALGKIKLCQWGISEIKIPAKKNEMVEHGVIKWNGKGLYRAGLWESSAPLGKLDDSLLVHGLSLMDIRRDQHLHLLTSVAANKVPTLHSDVDPYQAALSWIKIPESWNYRLSSVCFGLAYPPRRSGETGYLQHYDLQVEFKTPYPPGVVPTVVCWLQGLHMDRQFGYRINVEASQITNKGFRVTLMTWDQTKLFEATVGCFAYRTDNGGPRIFTTTGHFSKQELCTGAVPVTVQFPAGRFNAVPRCIGLIKKLDMREDRNPRLFARVEDVTRESVRFVGDSWDDTLMWGAEVLVIAASDV